MYRGEEFADLVGGTYIATDYCSSTVWALREDGAGGYTRPSSARCPRRSPRSAPPPEGEFYVVNDLPGGLHRVSFERAEPTCRIEHTTQTWGTGMTVDLTITNTGTTPINGWTLRFPLPSGPDHHLGLEHRPHPGR